LSIFGRFLELVLVAVAGRVGNLGSMIYHGERGIEMNGWCVVARDRSIERLGMYYRLIRVG
jgi:hypothetical protein